MISYGIMVRENSNTTPYLTNETKDICKLTLWYYYFTFLWSFN